MFFKKVGFLTLVSSCYFIIENVSMYTSVALQKGWAVQLRRLYMEESTIE